MDEQWQDEDGNWHPGWPPSWLPMLIMNGTSPWRLF